jgi:hypothetical protein
VNDLGELIDKEYGLKIWTNGTFMSLDGNTYHKIMFMTCPLVTTRKKWDSGVGRWDNIIFQVSLTNNQVLALKGQIDRLIETLGVKSN